MERLVARYLKLLLEVSMLLARILRLFALVLLMCAGQVAAQTSVPEHRYLYARDVDFYGADLANLFDTTQGACARACSAQKACVAFTYNKHSKACFPKTAITKEQAYVGAVSARKVLTDPAVLANETNRLMALKALTQNDLNEAKALVSQNANRFIFADETFENLTLSMAEAEREDRLQFALGWAGKAVALSDRSDIWTRYAGIALKRALKVKNSERRKLRAEALSAAINGYLRAGSQAAQVAALEALAQAFEANRRGRDMIPALRLALSFGPRVDLETQLDEAIQKYGFRITDHRIDNNAAAPRICAEFSEKLVQAGVDYDPFVRLKGRGFAVQVEGAQVCIDGVEHGQRYSVTFRKGLPSSSGEKLHRDVQLQLYVRDRSPVVRFTGRAYVLPRASDAALPVETVNVDTLDLRLRRVSDRNLVRTIRESYFGKPLNKYEDDNFAKDLAQEVWTGEGQVQNELNKEMTTRLPLGDVLAGQPAGIYALSASVPGQDPYDNPAATQWFVSSDLGLSTWSGVDGFQVAVRGLADTSPREGVKLSLISRANAVLGEVLTDADGFAKFSVGLTRGDGAAAPALLMAEDGVQDIAFLPLTDPAFDLSDRGVEGRPPAPPVDTFLTTDRGAYRVGDTIYATALVRDEMAKAVPGLPITAILKRPDGVEYSRQLSVASKAGGHVFAMHLGAEVPRGAWRVDIKSDVDGPALASRTVLVEDFLPERIDFDIALPDAPLHLEDSPPVSVNVRYLFGAPGAGLKVEGDLRLRAKRTIEGWPGYRFGLHDRSFRNRTEFIGTAETDLNGDASLALRFPQIKEDPGLPLEAQIILRVAEGSGRPVERRLIKSIETRTPMIGIKPKFEGTLPEGTEAAFDLVGLAPKDDTHPMDVRWTLNRVQTRYQWYQLYGKWEWEPATRRIRVATGQATLGKTPFTISGPTTWGRYELVVERLGDPYAVSSVRFNSGWYSGDGSTDTPDQLEMTLNAKIYNVGDPVQMRLVAQADGVALVSVLSNRVVERKVVTVKKGENTIPLKVTDAWGSGAYVTASVIHGMDLKTGQNPTRSLGLVHAAVRPAHKKLSVGFELPEDINGQAGTLRAIVTVDGLAVGKTAYVTLAAVDVGILNLTGFEAPDVTGHYFGQRRLGVEMRDLYGRLIDGLNGAMGVVRSGGDAAASAQVQSPPPTEKLMAFFAGPITVGADGRAEVEIIKPAFNGTIKLMAVAWSDTSVGNATQEIVARDPVVLTASLPRFLAPGDQSRLLLEIVHADGPSGAIGLEAFADAGIVLGDLPTKVMLEDQGAARLSIPLSGREIGDHLITVVATTPDGKELRKVLTVPVRNNDAEVSTTQQFSLGAGEKFTFDRNVFSGFQAGTARATLTAGPFARFDVPGLLNLLDRYPYGCTEQVTSGAMPLLYMSAVAQSSGLGEPDQIEDKINQAIARVLARQASNGAFGLWRPQSGEFWLDAYVTDFLSRARAQGHDVPDLAFSTAMDNLRNRIGYAPDFDNGGEDIAYALLVLAREGAAHMGDLRYYADTKAANFATPLALAQLGAALAFYGDQLRADRLFGLAETRLIKPPTSQFLRADFGTNLRDTAAVLKLSAESKSRVIDPVRLIGLVNSDKRSLSTQEAAQVVLAAHALSGSEGPVGLRVDGKNVGGTFVKQLTDRQSQPSVIENASGTLMDITMTTFGVPKVASGAGGYGYALKRTYYQTDGTPASGASKSGDRMVVVLEVAPFEKLGARLIINDPLPAGFEIDNPNLLRSGDLSGLDWLAPVATENAEFRNDRFVAAVNHREATPFQLAYIIRAVTPGTYHHPAATVQDMYRPEYHANTDTAVVTILP
jgi:uncharacterized protein YfaS (alpha-2-macroglobulin family)